MKKVKSIFNKIANANPMIWGYVMLNLGLCNVERQHGKQKVKFRVVMTLVIRKL